MIYSTCTTFARSPELTEAMNAAFAEPDPVKQKALYQTVNRMLMENAIVIPLWYDKAMWTISKSVHGADIAGWTDPAGGGFGKAWLDK